MYLSDRGWSPEGLIFFGTELLLCGASAYFYRIAFTPWTEKREEEGLTPRQTVSLLILAGTLLLTLSKITLLGNLSVGRCAAAAAVMATAYKGGIGVGATVGVACGLGMDLAAGGMPFYSMAFALSGVMCGVFHRQGRLAAALGVADRVIFPGFVSPMAPLYALADAAVTSSRSEGLPFNVMESMYAGLPVIASRVKGHTDLLEEGRTGLLYPFDDTAAFTSAVKRLLQEPDLSAALGTAAHDAVQPYALDTVLPQVMEQYLSLVPAAQPLRAPAFSTTDKE